MTAGGVKVPVLGVERSIGGRVWRARLDDERRAQAIAEQAGVPEIVARVLAARGVEPDTCARYLKPSLKADLPDPSSFRDMDRAAARLVQAIERDERIAIFGDYDVDGATSAALLIRFLKAVGASPMLYVPDRIKEGYGPNAPALLGLKAAGAGLVITVDCGIVAFEALAAAADAGLDVIVIDHHLAAPELPKAAAIINPNRLDESGAHKQLAAIGVAFLLVVATNRALRAAGRFVDRPEPNPIAWLDLVALGTVCDVVPLTGLNRAFVLQGLRVMARRGNLGIAALADSARLEEPPGTYHVGFVLGPRVNAGGRVGKSDLGARLLATEDAVEAGAIAVELERLNAERRAIEAQVTEEAEAAAAGQDAANPLVFVAGKGWHPGVIGIVASRLKERFGKPAFVIGFEGALGKGSGRSVPGVDLGGAVTAAREAGLLVNGGGHTMAAGLTVEADKVAALGEFLKARMARSIGSASPSGALAIDGALAIRAVTTELFDLLEAAGPFGAGNSAPRFVLPAVRVVRADPVGANHVRCILTGGDGGRLKAIAFRVGDGPLGDALTQQLGRPLHLVGHLRANFWQGVRSIEFEIKDAAYARPE